MKSLPFCSLTLTLLLATTTTAQTYPNQSAPFNLILTSADIKINGTPLGACHTGAALESLCLSTIPSVSKPNDIAPSTFHFNTSSSIITSPNSTLGTPGILTYWLQASNLDVPSTADFQYDPTTNIAVPIFSPGDTASMILSFDASDELLVQGYVDWSQDPPTAGEYTAYKRWWACKTYFLGYQYVNLAWGMGPGVPENPSCVKVQVVRRFLGGGGYGEGVKRGVVWEG